MSSTGNEPELVHATAVALGGDAALIRGPSGSGKSDLALRCLSTAPSILVPDQARLVADDRVLIERGDGGIRASCPPQIEGKIEVRGLGIIAVPALASARIVLVVDLVAPADVERYPLSEPRVSLLGCEIPLVRLTPFEASSAVKLLLALAKARGGH